MGLLITAIVAGGIAREQVIGLRHQLTLQQRLQRQQRVYDHIERLFDRDFVLMLTVAEELFVEKPESSGGWEALWTARGPQKQAEVLAAMNFFEIVAGEYTIPAGSWTDQWLRGWYPEPRAFEEWQNMHDS